MKEEEEEDERVRRWFSNRCLEGRVLNIKKLDVSQEILTSASYDMLFKATIANKGYKISNQVNTNIHTFVQTLALFYVCYSNFFQKRNFEQ